MRLLAQVVSLIFHPIFIPAYCVLYLIKVNPYIFSSTMEVLIITVSNSVVYPLLLVGMMYKLEFIDSLDLKDRDQRLAVFIPTMACFFWTFTVFFMSDFHFILGDVMLGASVSLAIAFVFTAVYENVSIHTIGMGGLVAVMLYSLNLAMIDTRLVFMLTVLMAGLVGTSRLVLKAHTPEQVYMGYMIGFSCQAMAFLI